ncbi:DUF2380 domain-containing protein [Salinisphaera aquimarina]|uniref:DUF2380 domain-containing protein n=1 Tax=Salinisphaera aquimarina TaxID=2094031 RepID=A0ABV7EMN4_9GAMM
MPVKAMVADFDYDDTSGEVRDQRAAHAEMMHTFVATLRQGLEDDAGYATQSLPCDNDTCTAGNMESAALIERARQSDARLLVFGGIHKMSTLVQWGHVYMVDLSNEKILLERSFSFRGDDERAFRRAGEFVAGTLARVTIEPHTQPTRVLTD